MGKINMGRVVLGGIVAGIVGDLLDYPVDGVWLAPRWMNEMGLLGHHTLTTGMIIGYDVLGIVIGILAVWLYAAIRPRFGAGLGTAIRAGVAVWILAVLVPNASFMYVSALFTKHLALYTTLGGLVEVVVGTIVGAWLYKEA